MMTMSGLLGVRDAFNNSSKDFKITPGNTLPAKVSVRQFTCNTNRVAVKRLPQHISSLKMSCKEIIG